MNGNLFRVFTQDKNRQKNELQTCVLQGLCKIWENLLFCKNSFLLSPSQWWPGVFFFRSKHCDPHPRNSSFCRQNALMYFWSSIADLTTVYNLAKMFLTLYLNYYNSTISSDIICIIIWSLAICFRHLLSKFSNDSYLSNQMALEFF